MSKGNISIIYRVEADLLRELNTAFINLSELQSSDKSTTKNFNEVLKEFSKVEKISFKNLPSSKSNISKDIKINSILVESFFKSKDDRYLENYIVFCFEVQNFNIVSNYGMKNLVNDFLKLNKLEESVVLGEVEAKYLRYMTQDDTNKRQEVSTLLGLTRAEKIETYAGELDNDHEQYIYKKTNTGLEYSVYSLEDKKQRGFDRVSLFTLALAYTNYYKCKTIEISKKAISMEIEQYDEILEYATDVARFEATYYFQNPTHKYYYDGFFKLLGVERLHNEFIDSLNGLTKFIGLLHTKKESQESELKLERENKRDKKINVTLGVLGIFLAILALPGILG